MATAADSQGTGSTVIEHRISGSIRILAVSILLLIAGARSEAQLVSNEKTMRLGTLEFTSSVTFVDDEKILETERVCTLEARMWTIAPDSSVTFVDSDSVAVIRQHTPPGLLYYFSALMYVGRLGSLELFTGAG